MADTTGWRVRPRDGQRFPVRITNELHTIEYNSAWNSYGFQLNEVPALNDVTLTAPIMQITLYDTSETPMEEVPRTTAPGPNQYIVDYDESTYLATGRIECNAADENVQVEVTYWGCGESLSVANFANSLAGQTIPGNLTISGDLSVANLSISGNISASGIIGNNPFLHVQDQKASGNPGGVGSTGWNLRTIDDVVTNTLGATFPSTTTITLPIGVYYINASAPAVRSNATILTLYNSDATSNILVGTVEWTPAAGGAQVRSFVYGIFTLSISTTISLRQWLDSAAGAATDLGAGDLLGSGSGVNQIYTDLKLWKIG